MVKKANNLERFVFLDDSLNSRIEPNAGSKYTTKKKRLAKINQIIER